MSGPGNDYSLAAIAYRAYGAEVNFTSVTGDPLPPWADLPARLQDAWAKAAEAAAEAVDPDGQRR
jgi:hypothetical protein